MKYNNIKEESLKLKVAADYFGDYDTTKIFGNIDFCVAVKYEKDNLFEKDIDEWHDSILWAEAKKGTQDIYKSLAQLVLTIGKARTFDKILPPPFLGVFDYEKIAFVHYSIISEIFYINDFNWNVTPSNYESKEFQLIMKKIKETSQDEFLTFNFEDENKELKKFVKSNFKQHNNNFAKTKITKNNFMIIYSKWLKYVKPTININWETAKRNEIIDGDFYLADILSNENKTLKDKLFVLLEQNYYVLDRKIDAQGLFDAKRATFSDNQKAHNLFWNKYERPPKEEYWEYIIERRDLLVPQDVRERKGSFFTPQIWVELSQKYLTNTLGENWQDEYYIWDCSAGTGNLLNGLTNKYNIWASTLDAQDIDVMKERIDNGANLLESHIFQFDFLNDDLNKVPKELQKIIETPEKRKKLIIYINPPYAEAGDIKQRNKTGKNKTNVAFNKVHDLYHSQLSGANRQLYAQFLIRIYNEFSNCIIAEFSTLKTFSGAHFKTFRRNFHAKILTGFIVPADTFDNVKGKFPIGFKIWDTSVSERINDISLDVFDDKNKYLGNKYFPSFEEKIYFSSWVNSFKTNDKFNIGWLQGVTRNDFQNQNGIIIKNDKKQFTTPRGIFINETNLIECMVCYAIRMCISANWLNDCDQFMFPNHNWKKDLEFIKDCQIFTIFHEKNTIQSNMGINHWIPFKESDVGAKEKFESNFMSNYIGVKQTISYPKNLFDLPYDNSDEFLVISNEAQDVFTAGQELWKYYHSKENINVNASLYDIKEFFQGRDKNGKMNNKSDDMFYTKYITNLRDKLKILAKKIEPKVYEYQFLLP